MPRLLPVAALVLLAACSGPGVSDAPRPAPVDAPAPTVGLDRAAFGLAAPREAQASSPGLAQHAQGTFWEAFYAGDYGRLDEVTFLLTAAYLQNPRDAGVTLLLAHAHLWRVAERSRLGAADPTITDHLALAEAYFEEAYRLAPDDHRIAGWIGSARMPLGQIRQDSALARSGLDLLEESARLYPEFNHFTAGFALSGLPADDPGFAVALDHMQANVDRCLGGADAPADVSAYEAALRANPVCANTEKAPHNYEGFMLNLGDMLVKAGEPERARAVYARAELSPTYDDWPYRETIEQRVLDADEAAALFASAAADPEVEEPETVFGSAYSCAACHQR